MPSTLISKFMITNVLLHPHYLPTLLGCTSVTQVTKINGNKLHVNIIISLNIE
jgi:hypothetical protein